MAKRLLTRYGWWVLSVLFTVCLLSGFLLLPDAHGGKIVDSIDEPAFDTELYKSMLSKLVADETELIDQFNADYLMLYPLMPPAADWQLVMEGGAIPYDKSSFPAPWFLDALTPTSDMGVSCYSIILWLDPATWQTIVFDEITMKEVTALSVPAGFNMLDFITAAWGEDILYGVDKEWVLSAYSPSRMAFRYRLFERDDVDDLVAEYSAASYVSELVAAPLKSAPLMMKSSSSSMEISAIEKTGSGMEITIELPEGWSSTNNIDVFRTGNLVSYWWSLLGTTNGSNTVTYTDTGSESSDVELRFYRAGDGDTDTDDDGIVDARELLMYHSDPDDEDSYPVTVSGYVAHTNTPQTGLIHVVAVTASNSWDLGRFDDLSSPGSFEITGIPNLDNYWIKAWRDWCDNDQVDLWEATGTATNCPIYLTNSVSNIVITLTDPPASISGTLSYTGKQEGAWIAIVSTVETSWTASASCTATLSGFYHLSDLSQTSYYVKAWIDADGDSTCDPNSEAQGFWTSNPIDLSNSVWSIDFELTDVNGDGDTMPDWWEIQHFGNTNQTDSGDYDNDQMPNAWEYEWDFCPTNAADAMDDADADGYPNVYEYKHESDPWNISDDPDGGGDPEAPTPSVIVVTNGSIQAGLDAAPNAYDIVRLDPGTYTGSTNRNLTFPSYPVLLIAKEAATNTIINCQSSGRAIFFSGQSNHTAVVQLTVANGSAEYGAGIYCISNASPLIRSCVIMNCTATRDGGGLYASNASPTLLSCLITGNIAEDDGGGLRCKSGTLTVTNCLITSNLALGNGGGVYVSANGSLIMATTSIADNRAQDKGGGVGAKDASVEMSVCSVTDNHASEDGGGFSFISVSNTLVDATVISGNVAWDDGGGIRLKDCSPTIRSCLLSGNCAMYNGGGIYLTDDCDPILQNCTMTDNEAWNGTGGALHASDTASAAVSTNSVFWGNTPDEIFATNFTAQYCTIQDWTGGGTGNVTTNPALTAGGLLTSSSPCINAGTNAAWMSGAIDIEGDARTNGIADIGADEFTDSDSDGLSDAWEISVFGSTGTSDGTTDSDSGGASDLSEFIAGTDATDPDDDYESDEPVTLAIAFGDISTSTSEQYCVYITNATYGTVAITNYGFGGMTSTNFQFERGEEYELRIEHVTNSPSSKWAPDADYDYRFFIDGQTNTGWIYGDTYIIDNTNGVLGKHGSDGLTPTFDGSNGVVRLYIIKVELTAYRPTTEGPAYGIPFQRHEVPDDHEENPGAGIRINGDTESAAAENDLIEVELEVAPFPVPSGVQYFLRRNNSNIKVWDSQTMGSALLDSGTEATITISSSPMSVWVENPSGGDADLELVAKDGAGNDICCDKVHFYPFSSVVVLFEGELRNPYDPPDAGGPIQDLKGIGISTIALNLYTNGYDVHNYEDSPTTAAFNEMDSAVEDRAVDSVALIGYSHGAGSVYDMSVDLDADATSFNLDFTAYIDAIAQPVINPLPETRRPTNTAFHVNYYQTIQAGEILLQGAQSLPTGAGYPDYQDNVDQPSATESHLTIDDAASIQAAVINYLKSKVDP